MESDLFGRFCALAAALSWAVGVVLFKRCGDDVAPIPLNLFKSVVSVVLLALTLIAMGEGFGPFEEYPTGDLTILLLSGLIGIALADTLFFYSLNMIGVGLESIVDCLYSPMVIFFSWMMLEEHLNFYDGVGAAMILSGVLVSTHHDPLENRTRRQLFVGLALGVIAVTLMAFGIVFTKPVIDLNGFPVIWASMLRLVGGVVVLGMWVSASSDRKKLWSVFKPSRAWRFTIPATFFGTYVTMMFWMAGFKYTKASVAGILNQTSVVFAIILAAIFLKERLTRRKLMAIAMAGAGAALVTLELPG